MFPWVPSGSMLDLRPAHAAAISVGDIVVYPLALAAGAQTRVVAHRVIAIEAAAAGAEAHYVVRGDAQDRIERMPVSGIIYVVTAVAHPRLRYSTEGRLGRMLAHWAVRRGRAWQLTCACARLGVPLLRYVPKAKRLEPAAVSGNPVST